MEKVNDANPSGAPEAGGATTSHSMFGGSSLAARTWRFLARVARDLESTAYRRLKEMEQHDQRSCAEPHPGAPKRAKEAAHVTDENNRVPIS